MIHLNTKFLHEIYSINPNHGISASDLKKANSNYAEIVSKVKSRKQGFVDLPFQTEVADKVIDYAEKVKGKFERIVILGIGGSMLGPQVIVEAFKNPKIEVNCVDNIDPFVIENLVSQITYRKTLFLVQTKSGGTPETLAQYLFFKEKVEQNGGSLQENFAFVTDPKNGYLREVANLEKVPSFEIPENVGGRFSVLTPVGLLVSALIGLDIKSMLAGAGEVMNKEFFDASSRSAFDTSISLFALSKKGKNEVVIMPYSSRLAKFSQWCIQLISESLGKEFDLKGNRVNAGITPISSLGATDQHSQLQLFKEGPNNKVMFFIEVLDKEAKAVIPSAPIEDKKGFEYLSNTSFAELIDAEFKGTRQSLTESLRPSLTLSIDKVNEANLGALFAFFELVTAFIGEMLEINTFDQPGVERSKVLTKEILLSD